MTAQAHTVLDGTLIRHGRHDWRWRDGSAEPRIRDLSPDEWNFRCRTYGDRSCYVEVLAGVARETQTLRWVLDGYRSGRYRSGASGDHTGPLVIDDRGARRTHIRPGEDPLLGSEPMPDVPGPIPRVILVPVADWDAWVIERPSGATWDGEHEHEILSRAYDLGWRPPERDWVSPRGWRAQEVAP